MIQYEYIVADKPTLDNVNNKLLEFSGILPLVSSEMIEIDNLCKEIKLVTDATKNNLISINNNSDNIINTLNEVIASIKS